MRWGLALSALTLVALTSPIAAGDKRSAALAVRVTVVRSCSVNTDMAPAGGTVNCGTRFGPPVLSASSTITVPLPTPPAARIDTTASAPALGVSPVAQGVAPVSDLAPRSEPLQTAEESDAPPEEDGDSAAVARVRGEGDGPGRAPRDHRMTRVAFRLVTVNF
jgi:hypothetical protein